MRRRRTRSRNRMRTAARPRGRARSASAPVAKDSWGRPLRPPTGATRSYLPPWSDPRRAAGGRVRGVLEGVVERRQIGGGDAQGGRRQPIGEPGVLGKQRAVEVRTHHRAVRAAANALEAARAVVAVALEHPPERRRARAEPGPAAVVL